MTSQHPWLIESVETTTDSSQSTVRFSEERVGHEAHWDQSFDAFVNCEDLVSGFLSKWVTLQVSESVLISSDDDLTAIDIDESDFADFSAEISRLEGNPEGARQMREARAWTREAFYSDAEVSIKTLRLEAGLSQSQLALAMDSDQAVISRWERGCGNLKASTIRRLAKVLGVESVRVWQAVERMSDQ